MIHMRKIWAVNGLIIFVLVGFVFAVFHSVENGQTDQKIHREWDLAEHVQKIEFYGTQQPVTILVETGHEANRLIVDGLVPKESLQTLADDSKASLEELYLPFSKHGFKLAVSQSHKDELMVTLELIEAKSLEEFVMDTWTGDVVLQVPEDFAARYDLDTNRSGKITSEVKSDENSSAIITINTYGNITVKNRK